MSEMKCPKFVLVDGSNYLFRAFYAIRELSNSKGFPTNAIYGFTNMLMKLLRDQEPDYIAVAFDVKGPTFRHEAYDGYKATRKATPDTLIPQIPFVKEIVRGFSIPVLEQQGIEADDIIGTIARRQAAAGMAVVIVSGDKDMMQLVSDEILMVDTMKEKTYDIAAVKERFGVGPEQVVEILGLMGDASDNIPGVPGIGPKGAERLIEQFGSIAAILAHPEQIHNLKSREAILRNADQARLSLELATIRTDAVFDFDLEACRRREPDRELLMSLFREFEFSSLLQELKIRGEEAAGDYRIVRTPEELEALAGSLRGATSFSIDLIPSSPEAMRASLVGIAIGTALGEAYYIPLLHEEAGAQLAAGKVFETLGPFLSDPAVPKHGHDLKTALILLSSVGVPPRLSGVGVPLRGLGCDTMVASYLLNPARHGYDLAEMVLDHLGRQIPAEKEIVGSGAKMVPFAGVPVGKTADYACRRADVVLALAAELEQKIAAADMEALCRDVEMPLVSVLAAMERHGVLLDLTLLKSMSLEIEQLLALSEEKIHRLAGEKFNVSSPKQLQTILFEKLGLPRGRKTKEGYSTDVDVLTSLALSHELPAEILAYRGMAKLKSTYIDALPELVHPRTGRVHTTYNQTVAATGRLSSSNPNLQNIPIRTLEGKRIRQAFIAPPGWEIVSADYSQIELRVLAHLSGDEALLAAFAAGEDIHSRTASDVFGVFPEMVNPDMRRQAKVINFGVLYGMSAFGLAKELGITQKLAQAYIDSYFQRYRGVRDYLDGLLTQARRDGYVTTLFKRRRYLPEIHSPQAPVRQFAERMAINAPIQGTAADLIKVAMVRIHRRLAAENLAAAMIMQVHDELVFEAPVFEREVLMALVREEMEGVLKLDVPLRVEVAAGRNWDEAHA
ncbi:MAG: DNA polymerase I [Deltaproteobacteria bacterium]|nr:DNA polymerase I [Deltaproteobacteria bacterium]